MTLARTWWLILSLAASPAVATDLWEPDGDASGPAGFNVLQPGAAPQLHDLQGNPDYDWFIITMRPYRSYEARLTNVMPTPSVIVTFDRYAFLSPVGSPLQVGVRFDMWEGFNIVGRALLRWETATLTGVEQIVNLLKVQGPSNGTAAVQYSIALRDTTLFCPRYNNMNGQVSVLLVQPALEGSNSCIFTARFFDEAGTLVGNHAGVLGDSDLKTIATASVPGVANTKGGARITHTCGLNRIKAKLVALEPATGFSFDTPCSTIE